MDVQVAWGTGTVSISIPDRVAVTVVDDDLLFIWLVDAATGEARELGRFRPPPIGGTLWHRWTADGRGVIETSRARVRVGR